MHNSKKTRVMVLYGGRSVEHEIALRSAASVVKHLDRERFEVIPVGIDKQGHWLLGDAARYQLGLEGEILELEQNGQEVVLPPYQALREQNHASTLIPLQDPTITQHIDVIFPVLHGTYGEDGTMQGLFELVGVPYVGAGVLSSAIAMDKDIAKRLIMAAGLPIVPYLAIKQGDWKQDSPHYQQLIAERFTYPMFVKPANTGSSVGIHKVKQQKELLAAIQDAFRYDTKILIEQGMAVREIEVAVLESRYDGQPALTSVPGEIIPTHEFYSYEAKYLDENGAQLIIPAELDANQVYAAQQLARQIFDILDCEGMARVDLFLERQTRQFYFNEANTLPGFTNISMYPKLWEASGISYAELLTHLIELAIKRQTHKQGLCRDHLSS